MKKVEYYCDRCQVEIKDKEKKILNIIPKRVKVLYYHISALSLDFIICSKCYDEFVKWWDKK